MSERFSVGDKVAWYAVAGGKDGKRHDKRHVGTVVSALPEGTPLLEAHFQHPMFAWLALPVGSRNRVRDHESYLIYENGKTTRQRGKLYWPRVSQLRRVE